MPEDDAPQGRVQVGVSVQNDGQTVGLHIDVPGTSYAVGFPYGYVEQLRDELPDMLTTALVEAEKQRSGLVLPDSTLSIVKG